MNNRLRRIFLMAILAAAGLLYLQIYWVYKEWTRSTDILQREADYAFQQAVDKEWSRRKDTLAAYLAEKLHDTSFIQFGTQFNEKEKIWMIKMYDPRNPKDYTSWSNELFPVTEHLSEEEREGVIGRFIKDNLKKSIGSDIIFFYTQRLGKAWTKKVHALALDTARLRELFKRELAANKINTAFTIRYFDTTGNNFVQQRDGALYTKSVSVQFNRVNDIEKKYMAQARIPDPGFVVLKRIWLVGMGSLLLLALTFWSLYRMYITIIRQKQLDELKDDFISNMTHELKTPIATVTAAVDGLQYYDAMQDRQRAERYLETSRRELKRLDEMVSKVLELSADHRMREQLRKERFLLHEFLGQILGSFLVQSEVNWQLTVKPGLTVLADRQKLMSVFQNLVENSIKYGNGKTSISIAAHEHDGHLEIVFQDNGPGIDPAFLPFIFQKFYRVPSGKHKEVKGFGLGLYQVYNIIAAHGGTVKAATENGLFFTITLPLI